MNSWSIIVRFLLFGLYDLVCYVQSIFQWTDRIHPSISNEVDPLDWMLKIEAIGPLKIDTFQLFLFFFFFFYALHCIWFELNWDFSLSIASNPSMNYPEFSLSVAFNQSIPSESFVIEYWFNETWFRQRRDTSERSARLPLLLYIPAHPEQFRRRRRRNRGRRSVIVSCGVMETWKFAQFSRTVKTKPNKNLKEQNRNDTVKRKGSVRLELI